MKKNIYVKPDVEMFETEADSLLDVSHEDYWMPEEGDDGNTAKDDSGIFGNMTKGSSSIFSSVSYQEMDASTGPF